MSNVRIKEINIDGINFTIGAMTVKQMREVGIEEQKPLDPSAPVVFMASPTWDAHYKAVCFALNNASEQAKGVMIPGLSALRTAVIGLVDYFGVWPAEEGYVDGFKRAIEMVLGLVADYKPEWTPDRLITEYDGYVVKELVSAVFAHSSVVKSSEAKSPGEDIAA